MVTTEKHWKKSPENINLQRKIINNSNNNNNNNHHNNHSLNHNNNKTHPMMASH